MEFTVRIVWWNSRALAVLKRKKCKHVAIIVDNPNRDLDGLVLLAKHLAGRGMEASLIPMYTQGFQVPALVPDLVVMNYARKANRELIRAYSKAGIAVAVVDTEGGIWESDEQFVKSIDHQALVDFIDLYCLWGPRQCDALLRLTRFTPDRLVVTGSPRYDFYADPWWQSVKGAQTSSRPIVLVISNFCLAYPRFSRSVDVEVENMVASGYERRYAQLRAEGDRKGREELIKVLDLLLGDFPEVDFILRPHPFEDESEYITRYRQQARLRVDRSLTVAPWLKSCMLTIHMNSSVAIDAFIGNRPVASLSWVCPDILKGISSVTLDVSYPVRSYEELRDHLRLQLQKQTHAFALPETQLLYAKKKIESWFHKADGQASARVAEEIENFLNKRVGKPSAQECLKMALYGTKSPRSLSGWMDGLGRFCFGAQGYNFLRTWVLTKNIGIGTKSAKNFSHENVRRILEQISSLSEISQDRNCRVGQETTNIKPRNRLAGRIIQIKPGD